jgi:transposase
MGGDRSHLPTNQPGPERQDDRRMLSGIIHVLEIGCRWQDCPKDYGPHKTVYNRFARWSERGVWQKTFDSVASPAEPPEQAALDSSHVKSTAALTAEKGADFQAIGLRKAAEQQDSRARRRTPPALGVHPGAR